MRTWLACLALATAHGAQAPRRCPDGRPPVLTGQPFRPSDCPSSDEPPASAAAAVSNAALPDVRDAARSDLKPLDGRWRGIVTIAGGHYEIELNVSNSGRLLRWSEMDLRTHDRRQLAAELKVGFWSKAPPLKATISAPELPGQTLSAQVWLGAAPLENGSRPPLDRLAVWTYSGRPQQHRVQYALEGERLRGTYTCADPRLGPIATSLELARVKP